MNKKTIAAASLIVAILFVSMIAGTILYYDGVVSNRDSIIGDLSSEIAIQNNQVSDLKSQLTTLIDANLSSTLGAAEFPAYTGPNYPDVNIPYSHLYITGSINNTGIIEAYNVGLNILAYEANGTCEINMTVPLGTYVSFGTDNATNSFVSDNYLWLGNSSLQLGTLGAGQSEVIRMNIFHEGTVKNWTLTSVGTNFP